MGQCLLAAKRCILTTVTQEEKSEALKLWRQNIALIQTLPEQSVETDGLADLLTAAKAVGVSILFTGSLPSVGTTARMLTEAAVHECLTNTVRHFRGNELYVEISQEELKWTIHCTNNGTPPGGPIQEGGGLSSLCRRVIQAGGTMWVEAAQSIKQRWPQIKIIIVISMPEYSPEPDPDPDPELEPEPKKDNKNGLLVVVLVVALAGGGAVYFLKFKKNKPDTKGNADLDDYDYGDEDETEDEDA